MVVAGAGGHALEVFDVLLQMGYSKESVFFYDDVSEITEVLDCSVIKSVDALNKHFKKNRAEFCLGVGKPELRKKFYNLFSEQGGKHVPLKSPTAFVSESCINHGADIMAFAFVSAKSYLGKGCLINTRANIHHEVKIGEFSEISPASNLLGAVKVGDLSSLGANTNVLPKVEIGNKVISGAGTVITKQVISNQKIIGVPGVLKE